MKTKKTIIVLLLFLLATVQLFQNSLVYAMEEVASSAKAVCVLEGNTNTVLFEKNAHAKLPIASTTKIVTAILAIEHFSNHLDQEIQIHPSAVGMEGTSIYLEKGESLTVRELLYGLMLASGNDAAVALAMAVAPTQEEFVVKMNEFANKLNCKNTNFNNPHGLDDPNHYTSAYDLSIITSYALKNDTFKEVVSTKFKTVTGTSHSGQRNLRNKNKLIFTQENNIGVKTGFTDAAGRCLVNATEENGMQIITVVLNCGPMFEEARSFTDLAKRTYVMKEFVTPYQYVGTSSVEDGEKNAINIVSIQGFKLPVKIDDEKNYEVKYNIPDVMKAPIFKEDVIGSVEVTYNGSVIYQQNLYAMEDIKNVDLNYTLNNIMEHWFN